MTNAVLTCGFAVTLVRRPNKGAVDTKQQEREQAKGPRVSGGSARATAVQSVAVSMYQQPLRMFSWTNVRVRKSVDGDHVLDFSTPTQWVLWPFYCENNRRPR